MLGRASSSMVFPRGREDGDALKVRLRKDIEVRLRSRRFYWRFSVGSAHEGTRGVLHMGAAMAYRGDWERRWLAALAGRRAWRPFIPSTRGRWLYTRERGWLAIEAGRQAGRQIVAKTLNRSFNQIGGLRVNQMLADHRSTGELSWPRLGPASKRNNAEPARGWMMRQR